MLKNLPGSKHLTPAMESLEAVEMEISHCDSTGVSSSASAVPPQFIFATALELALT